MSDDPQPYELTYDEIVELIVDVSDGLRMREPHILAALRELEDRRIQERVNHNLNLSEVKV
jgi:hypothetical protein